MVKVVQDGEVYRVIRRAEGVGTMRSRSAFIDRKSAEILAVVWSEFFGLELLP